MCCLHTTAFPTGIAVPAALAAVEHVLDARPGVLDHLGSEAGGSCGQIQRDDVPEASDQHDQRAVDLFPLGGSSGLVLISHHLYGGAVAALG